MTKTELEMINGNVKNNIDVTMDNQQPSSCPKGGEGSTTSESTSLVVCKICGSKFKELNSHLNRKHKISCKEYLIYKQSLVILPRVPDIAYLQ